MAGNVASFFIVFVYCCCTVGAANESEARGETIFLKAIQSVLDDDSFKIKSTNASEARKVAISLLEWCTVDVNKQ